jgi:hypothetical protein
MTFVFERFHYNCKKWRKSGKEISGALLNLNAGEGLLIFKDSHETGVIMERVPYEKTNSSVNSFQGRTQRMLRKLEVFHRG